MTRYVYISLSGDNKISVFNIDENNGKLAHIEDVPFHDGPGPLALNPCKPILYAALRSSQEVQTLRIDTRTGGLSPVGSLRLKEGPAMISTDRRGRYLMGAYYGAGAVSVNPLDADGVVGDRQVQWEETTERAHYIQADESNKFVFVPHVLPGNAIYRLQFDEEMGTLTANAPHFEPPVG